MMYRSDIKQAIGICKVAYTSNGVVNPLITELITDRGMGGNESRETGLRAFVLSKP